MNDQDDLIQISRRELEELKEKAARWNQYTNRITSHLPVIHMTKEERSVAARKAANARWEKYRENQKKS